MSALLPFDDAFARLLSHADTLPGTETIDTMNADGRVLARALVSSLDVPPWDNAQMDGYAVRAADLAASPDGVFPVSQRIPAGHQGQPLQPGTVARIFTGAALPPGADAVVMQEEVEAGLQLPVGEGTGVRFRVQPASGAWVRRRAEDIAAWAETPSGAPSGFSAAQPAVEQDMFGAQMAAQMPPPQQQKQSSRSGTGRLVAIIVVLLLIIAGGGGVWAGNYFASKDKGGDSSRDRADTNGDEGGQQNNGQADAAATSTAAALPSGAVKACSSMPTFTITSVEDGQGELKVRGNVATACTEGDFLAGSSNRVLVYSSTSPTGGTDADHLVASGTFDLSSDPLIIPNGGRTVTLRFGEQHYFRTARACYVSRLSQWSMLAM